MEKRNWSSWLPPRTLPNTGDKDFKAGQVWASRCSESGSVRRIIENSSGNYYRYELLAGSGGALPMSGDSNAAGCAVLVQDVGQAEPTSPGRLYGGSRQEDECTPMERDWSRWIPPEALLKRSTPTWVKGQVWACRAGSGHNGVFRVIDPKGDKHENLAGNGEYFSALDSGHWSVLVQDVDQENPTPPEILYGEPKNKETDMPETKVNDESWKNDVNWADHILDAEGWVGGPRIDPATAKRGQVYAYYWDKGRRGVFQIQADGDAHARLLAHTVSSPQDDWNVPGILGEGKAVLIAHPSGWVNGYAKAPQMHKRPAPLAKPKEKREVSVDGLQYVDYDKMGDSDSFETYPYYRIRKPDGTFSVDERPVMEQQMEPQLFCRMSGCTNSGPFGRNGECQPCYAAEEAIIATKTATMQRGRSASVTRVRDYAPRQSHSMFWGGVFSLRE